MDLKTIKANMSQTLINCWSIYSCYFENEKNALRLKPEDLDDIEAIFNRDIDPRFSIDVFFPLWGEVKRIFSAVYKEHLRRREVKKAARKKLDEVKCPARLINDCMSGKISWHNIPGEIGAALGQFKDSVYAANKGRTAMRIYRQYVNRVLDKVHSLILENATGVDDFKECIVDAGVDLKGI